MYSVIHAHTSSAKNSYVQLRVASLSAISDNRSPTGNRDKEEEATLRSPMTFLFLSIIIERAHVCLSMARAETHDARTYAYSPRQLHTIRLPVFSTPGYCSPSMGRILAV